MRVLPKLMIAPNGATRTKDDHPAIPITENEIVKCAIECADAGADGIHFHLRDHNGKHILDSERCAKFISRLRKAVPSMIIQATSESAGIYSPSEQINFVKNCGADFVSVGLREIERLKNENEIRAAYHAFRDLGIWVQHILYDNTDFERLIDYNARGIIPEIETVLFVCGRYNVKQNSTLDDLLPFLQVLGKSTLAFDWAVCAFGKGESAALKEAQSRGGKIRVGFENSIWNSDGTIAASNVLRVKSLMT